MGFYKRFSNIFTQIEIEYAHSLPILTANQEIVFFYEERKSIDHRRIVGEIRYIAYKEIKSGEEYIFEAKNCIPSGIIEKIQGVVLSENMSIEEELDKEDKYVELYDKIFSYCKKTKDLKEDLNLLLVELKDAVNSEALYSLYKYLFNHPFEVGRI